MSDEEPDRVWEVSCSCGYCEKFRHKEDAQEVFDAHGQNWDDPRCGSGEMKAMHAYPEGGVDPEKTLPGYRDTVLENAGETSEADA